MKQDSEPDWALIVDYVSGAYTPDRQAEIEREIAENPELHAAVGGLQEFWNTPVRSQSWSEQDLKSIKKGVNSRIRAGLDNPIVRDTGQIATITAGAKAKWVGYAAVGMLACMVTIFSWKTFLANARHSEQPSKEYITYSTRPGQRAALTLSDGSHVTLGPATTMRLEKNPIVNKNMSVEITGEALFDVTHTAQRSFTVTSYGVKTRVLGTEFLVRAYEASNVRVAVRNGRVSVQNPLFTSASSTIVNAGEATSVTPNALPAVTEIYDLATDFAWANGELVMRNVPLGEAFTRLSRWYGVEFKISNPSLLKSRVNATFPSEFSRTKMDILARAIRARTEYGPNTIIFLSEE